MTGAEGYPFRGELDFASISLTPTTGTLLMRGHSPNQNGKILPGVYATVRVPVEKRPAFIIPAVALGYDQQGPYVFIVNEKNTVERRSVKPGPESDGTRVIYRGSSGEGMGHNQGAIAGRSRPAGHARTGPPGQGKAMISRFFIERPILANVLAVITVIIGVICLYRACPSSSTPLSRLPPFRSRPGTPGRARRSWPRPSACPSSRRSTAWSAPSTCPRRAAATAPIR